LRPELIRNLLLAIFVVFIVSRELEPAGGARIVHFQPRVQAGLVKGVLAGHQHDLLFALEVVLADRTQIVSEQVLPEIRSLQIFGDLLRSRRRPALARVRANQVRDDILEIIAKSSYVSRQELTEQILKKVARVTARLDLEPEGRRDEIIVIEGVLDHLDLLLVRWLLLLTRLVSVRYKDSWVVLRVSDLLEVVSVAMRAGDFSVFRESELHSA